MHDTEALLRSRSFVDETNGTAGNSVNIAFTCPQCASCDVALCNFNRRSRSLSFVPPRHKKNVTTTGFSVRYVFLNTRGNGVTQCCQQTITTQQCLYLSTVGRLINNQNGEAIVNVGFPLPF